MRGRENAITRGLCMLYFMSRSDFKTFSRYKNIQIWNIDEHTYYLSVCLMDIATLNPHTLCCRNLFFSVMEWGIWPHNYISLVLLWWCEEVHINSSIFNKPLYTQYFLLADVYRQWTCQISNEKQTIYSTRTIYQEINTVTPFSFRYNIKTV